MLAKEANGSATTPTSGAVREDEPRLAPGANPDAAVDQVLALLSEERYPAACRLAAAALAKFPSHARVKNAWSIFEREGKATVGPQASEPDREKEREWLRDPPASARGKWVALLGKEMIDAADTLRELEESLSSRELPKPALVHYVD